MFSYKISHIVNRGVDKRDIFLDDQDYFRFVHDLFEFNDQERVNSTFYTFQKSNDLRERKIERERRKRKLLVDVLAFCLMPNHYHLLLSPRVQNGVPLFMQKLNAGYVKYFNEKNKRRGTLFEGRYKSILVTDDAHFIHLPYYIHLNPLDLVMPEWRERKIQDPEKALRFLESYRWSSYPDYVGIKNFPSVTNREFLSSFLSGSDEYRKETARWLRDLDLVSFHHLTLE